MLNEINIVYRLKNKDLSAFNQLYDAYAPALYGMIFKLVQDTAIADSIIKRSFQYFWHNISTYEETSGRLFPWMIRISISNCNEAVSIPKQKLVALIAHKAIVNPCDGRAFHLSQVQVDKHPN